MAAAPLSTQDDFKSWISYLKSEVKQAQIKAAVKVNTELLRLYWHLGAEIVEKQKKATWGDGWLKELSRELLSEFPDMKGFSLRNLQSVRKWYLFYSQSEGIAKQVVSQMHGEFFSVPWGHHLYILAHCGDVQQAFFYLHKTLQNGWSRSMLLNFLDSGLYERQGCVVSNFERLLPQPQSDLARQTLKDPYNFDFLTLTEDYREKELEDALTGNITRFLLELGQGFAYVGRQIPIEVGDETLFIDLLFYHLELRCFVVVELKTKKFKGEHLGQLGLYISAVNHLYRKPSDNATVGLLICKTKNDVMAQYALEGSSQPIGISSYELSRLMPAEIRSQLPTIEEIENHL